MIMSSVSLAIPLAPNRFLCILSSPTNLLTIDDVNSRIDFVGCLISASDELVGTNDSDVYFTSVTTTDTQVTKNVLHVQALQDGLSLEIKYYT
jgi:hypothetical protein